MILTNLTLTDYTTKYILVYVYLFLIIYFLNLLILVAVVAQNINLTNNFFKTLKIIAKTNTLDIYWLLFASLLGIPPFGGFVVKTIIGFYILGKYGVYIFTIFFLIIVLNIFFYVQYFKIIKELELSSDDLTGTHLNFIQSERLYYRYLVINILTIMVVFFLLFIKDFYFIAIYLF